MLRLKGKGLPKAERHGDLLVTPRIVLPEGADAELEALMRKWRDGTRSSVRGAGFDEGCYSQAEATAVRRAQGVRSDHFPAIHFRMSELPAAGLDLGGGKAVILDDGLMPPGSALRAARLEAAGRLIDGLGGAYVTAEDVGTCTEDMESIAPGTRFVVGRAASAGGLGDPSPDHRSDGLRRDPRLAGARRCPAAPGPEGSPAAPSAWSASARSARPSPICCSTQARGCWPTTWCPTARPRTRGWSGGRTHRLRRVMRAPLDVLAPARSADWSTSGWPRRWTAAMVCGAANNPLAGAATAALLADRGVLYVPDFLANCGGLVHVAAEWERRGGDGLAVALERAERQVERVLADAAAR